MPIIEDDELKNLINKLIIEKKDKDIRSLISDRKLVPLLHKIDDYLWQEIKRTLINIVNDSKDKLLFNKYHRLLIDCGWFNDELIGKEASKVKTAILKELYTISTSNIFYLSEWLNERLKSQMLIEAFSSQDVSKDYDSKIFKEKKILKLIQMRAKIYNALSPYFDNLPGLTPKLKSLLLTGEIDNTIQRLHFQQVFRKDPVIEEKLEKLISVRNKIISRARERCIDTQALKGFESLIKISQDILVLLRKISTIRTLQLKKELKADTTTIHLFSKRVKKNFILKELHLVKSLLKLGVPGAGITRTCSVLLTPQIRITKKNIENVMQIIMEVDPRLPGSPNILVAPFCGTGFFEWDRDTVFVPLVPVRSIEEAIANAFANYRIMIDTLHNQSKLKRAYKEKFGKINFRDAFIQDYKNWILGVAKGFRGKMLQESYDFFRAYIGPNANTLFAPKELTTLTKNETIEFTKKIRMRIQQGISTFVDHYRLSVLYWRLNRPQEALNQMAMAVKLNPTDARSMFTLGYMCTVLGIEDKARSALKEVLNIAPNTLWQVYATEILAKI